MKWQMSIDGRHILIDADVVSHFVTAAEGPLMKQIFPGNKIWILDKVHAELQRWPNPALRTEVSLLISNKTIRLMDFPEDDEAIVKEYAWIKSMLFKGEGESACLAVVRHRKQILGSSNLTDIKNYCKMHKIDYLTTMDFLCHGLQTGILDVSRCNTFIQKVKTAGGKLPVNKMEDYNCREINFLS